MGHKNSMFRYADGTDKLLMFFGTLGSIGDGLQNPLMMYVLSEVINSYGKGQVTNADVDKVIKHGKFSQYFLQYKAFSICSTC